jgi:uncharacterized membrane protein
MHVTPKVVATQLLRDDHDKVRGLFKDFLDATAPSEVARLGEELCRELEIHAWLEERLAYPALARACPELPPGAAMAGSFANDHQAVKRLISRWRLNLGGTSAAEAISEVSVAQIMAAAQPHMAEEESLAFPALARDAEADAELGAALGKLKLKLKMFPPIQRCIEVRAPLRKVYDQWTQFESFPRFMEPIKEVRQLEAAKAQWCAEVAGKELRWNAEIFEQEPDQRIAWRSVDGAAHTGSVSFLPLAPDATRMLVELCYEPQGLVEDLGALLGLLSQGVGAALERFKAFIESTPAESGAWRGRIEGSPLDPGRGARGIPDPCDSDHSSQGGMPCRGPRDRSSRFPWSAPTHRGSR